MVVRLICAAELARLRMAAACSRSGSGFVGVKLTGAGRVPCAFGPRLEDVERDMSAELAEDHEAFAAVVECEGTSGRVTVSKVLPDSNQKVKK